MQPAACRLAGDIAACLLRACGQREQRWQQCDPSQVTWHSHFRHEHSTPRGRVHGQPDGARRRALRRIWACTGQGVTVNRSGSMPWQTSLDHATRLKITAAGAGDDRRQARLTLREGGLDPVRGTRRRHRPGAGRRVGSSLLRWLGRNRLCRLPRYRHRCRRVAGRPRAHRTYLGTRQNPARLRVPAESSGVRRTSGRR